MDGAAGAIDAYRKRLETSELVTIVCVLQARIAPDAGRSNNHAPPLLRWMRCAAADPRLPVAANTDLVRKNRDQKLRDFAPAVAKLVCNKAAPATRSTIDAPPATVVMPIDWVGPSCAPISISRRCLAPTTAHYLDQWLEVLREDKRAIFAAAPNAS